MKCLNFYLSAFCCVISPALFAQTPQQIEADLLKSFKKIDYCRDKKCDSLETANDVFAKKLKFYTEKSPFTITYPFNSLKKDYLDISTSSDGLFRIYSWDTWTGGTMHFFESVMQYKSGTGFKAIIDTPKTEGDNRPDYQRMFTFKANGKAYYICTYLYVGSTKDVSEGIHLFTIENEKLTDAKILKTHSGLNSDITYYYDFGSVVNIEYEKRPHPRFDNLTNTIYLPMVDGNQQMTKKFILYKFTGQYFERVKN
ncbi:MAG: hypothetical protein JSU01_23180 [Bacteroidetes bacterium]|nr:hypothetical protein [Bacteroidota bacterium]